MLRRWGGSADCLSGADSQESASTMTYHTGAVCHKLAWRQKNRLAAATGRGFALPYLSERFVGVHRARAEPADRGPGELLRDHGDAGDWIAVLGMHASLVLPTLVRRQLPRL